MRINFNFLHRFTFLLIFCLLTVEIGSAQKTDVPSSRQITVKVDEYMNAAVKFNHSSGSVSRSHGTGSPSSAKVMEWRTMN